MDGPLAWLRWLAAALLAFLLGWNALLGAKLAFEASVPREPRDLVHALTWGERERIDQWLARSEPAYGLPAGYGRAVLEAVERHVPPDGTLVACGPFREPTWRIFPVVQALCYPRLVEALEAFPSGWPARPEDYDPRIHVATFGTTLDLDLAPSFERLEAHEHFALWRCREGPP